jgi:hypothetical protein
MTLNFAPWAIDGARSTSALARLATYATGGGRSGVIKASDLKVRALAVPGNGLRISSGGALVLNGYQVDPDQAYAVSNGGEHVVLSADMPAPVGATAYYLVCVVVGDPEFDQTEHPFMPSSILPEDAADYEYVRIVIVPCSAGVTQFEQLGLQYPGYALARLEVPAMTSTITQAMITDLRTLTAPRESRKILIGGVPPNQNLTMPDFADWATYQPYVQVPPWATHAQIIATLTGIVGFGASLSDIRPHIGPHAGIVAGFDLNLDAGGERITAVSSFDASVADIAGTSVMLKLQARRVAESGYLTTWDSGSIQLIFDVQFSENVI